MNTDNTDIELRSKDIAILQAIHQGATDTAEIKNATTLTNREINYSLTEYSLEQQDLVTIHHPSTQRETRQINDTERDIWTPKNVELTDQGLQILAELDTDQGSQYEDMNRDELVQRVRELEQRQDRFESVFKDFRANVMERI